MICSISGTTPEDPVVSTKSGNVFERRLIEKYIETNNKDPNSGEPLTKEDLVAIKVNKTIKPRPATATSIPSMLQLFQNEWDALMLETFTLKQHLDTVRQELAHALYQHDAACRVIARLIKERDSARNALASLQGQAPVQQQGAPSGGAEAMDVDGGAGFTKAIEDKLKAKSDELLKTRKKRAVPAGLADEESIKSFKVSSTNSGIHKASPAGITSVDIHPTKQELIATGGVDSNAHIFNHQTNKIVASLSGHSKRVNQVSFHPTDDVVFTASQDRTARIWKADGDAYSCAHVVKVHSDDVVGISLQATGDYIATASADKTWALSDIHSGACITKITDDRGAYSSVLFHPDGLLLGAGTKDNVVRIWDIKARQVAATFEGHTSAVTGLAFSENGYHLATASSDAVKLWDLRKLRNFQTINLKDVSSVSYDHTGTYLLVAHENNFSVYGFNKQFNHVHTFSEHKDKVTNAKFGKDATWIASVSMDRSLKIHNQ